MSRNLEAFGRNMAVQNMSTSPERHDWEDVDDKSFGEVFGFADDSESLSGSWEGLDGEDVGQAYDMADLDMADLDNMADPDDMADPDPAVLGGKPRLNRDRFRSIVAADSRNPEFDHIRSGLIAEYGGDTGKIDWALLRSDLTAAFAAVCEEKKHLYGRSDMTKEDKDMVVDELIRVIKDGEPAPAARPAATDLVSDSGEPQVDWDYFRSLFAGDILKPKFDDIRSSLIAKYGGGTGKLDRRALRFDLAALFAAKCEENRHLDGWSGITKEKQDAAVDWVIGKVFAGQACGEDADENDWEDTDDEDDAGDDAGDDDWEKVDSHKVVGETEKPKGL